MTVKVKEMSFEDALEKTGFGKYNYLMLLLCGVLMTSMVFESVSVSYIVPAGACEMETTNSQQGIIAGMPLIGIIATSHFWGFFADTKGRKKILQLSLIFGFIGGSLATFSPHWVVLCILKLFSCSAVSATLALSFTLISECTPRQKRNLVVILTGSIYFVAASVMSVLAILVLPLNFSYGIPVLGIQFNSWRLLNLIFALPCAIGAIGLIFSYESPKYLITAGKHSEALEVLQGMFVINCRKSREEFEVDRIILEENSLEASIGIWQSIKAQTLPLVRTPLLKNTLLLSVIIGLVYFTTYPYILWMPSIADTFIKSIEKGDTGLRFCDMMRSTQNVTNVTMDESRDCSLNQTALLMVFAIQLLLAVCSTLMGPFMECIGRKTCLIGIQLLTGLAGLCINFITNWMIIILLFIVYMCGVLSFPLTNTYSVDLFPTYVKAMAICVTVMAGRLTSVFGVNLLKNLLVDNCEASFYLFPGLAMCCGFIGFLLPSERSLAKKIKTSSIYTNEQSQDT